MKRLINRFIIILFPSSPPEFMFLCHEPGSRSFCFRGEHKEDGTRMKKMKEGRREKKEEEKDGE